MSKANTIRKKALEYARRQDWDAAIREYRRLAEIDQTNPNIYNELGDIYLKTGNKSDAYDSFAAAIDAYSRVSLYNNAVAVCKKVLRIIPARYEVHAKLGCIRKRQGLAKEAESYCLQYLDRLGRDASADARVVASAAEEIADAMDDCAVVLDRVAERLIGMSLDREASRVLVSLYKLYESEGVADAKENVRQRLESIGMGSLVASEPAPTPAPAKEGPVITEDNIWTDSHSEGQRIVVEAASVVAPPPPTMGSDPDAPPPDTGDLYDYRTVNLSDSDQLEDEVSSQEKETTPGGGDGKDAVHVSAIIDGTDDELSDGVNSEDYRSHYDLGMAYLEMNLFAEAVREYQLAAKSADFRIKSLEMIGLCFLKQNQAQLAIKQLTRGLRQIDENDPASLGIKYNLGLAYEMAGEDDKAQAMFEDVYVVDISFRDVAAKMARFSKQ